MPNKLLNDTRAVLRQTNRPPSAVQVLRKVLADADDHSVRLVTVGYLTNVADLLRSEADANSPLTGIELARQKVNLFVVMGGRYPEHLDPKKDGNFKPDPDSAVFVAENWPGAIHFSGQGEKVATGRKRRQLPNEHPLRVAYDLFLGDKPTRSSWNQVASLFTVRPDTDYWTVKTDGGNHLFVNSTNRWVDDDHHDHRLVQFTDERRQEIGSEIERLMMTPTNAAVGHVVDNTIDLVAAVRNAPEGETIEIAPGTYKLSSPLEMKPGMTLKGAGMDETLITHVTDWSPPTTTLPHPEMKTDGMDTRAYLIRLQDKAASITVSNITLRGPQLHGAIFGWGNHHLHLHHLRIEDTLWTGIRTFAMERANIHDCEFIDAGGRWERGKPGVKGGITGRAIFAIWMKDSEIAHNRFRRTQMGKVDEFYGIKVRKGKRCRVHHNWFRDSDSIEFVRNCVEIDHNLLDFETEKDHGNLISGFGRAVAEGPATFHNNLVSNPDR